MDQPWINMDQRGSSVLQLPPWRFCHALSPFSVQTHGSCVMRSALSPFSVESVQRPLTWHASTRHAPRVMLHASCSTRHDSTRHAPRVMLHASCSTRHDSTRHAPRVHVLTHAPRPDSCVHASTHSAAPFSRSIQPLHSAAPFSPRGGISHRLYPLGQCPINALNFAPLSYTA